MPMQMRSWSNVHQTNISEADLAKAEAEANEQIEYLRLIGGEKATDSMRNGKTFSEVAFGSCGFPSDFADALGDA